MNMCEPNLHGGQFIPATFLVQELDGINKPFFGGRSFAACNEHLSDAVEFVMGDMRDTNMRVVKQVIE
jgi:hypothetical protein